MGRRRVVRAFLRAFLGIAVLPIFVAIAVNAATDTSFPGPLRLIQIFPWQSVLVGLVGVGVYAVWELRTVPSEVQHPTAQPLTEAEQVRLRRRLVGETRRIWVDGVLAHSLDSVLRIELSLVSQQSRVSHPVQLLLRSHGDRDEVLPDGARRADIFQQLGQRLLVLGEPGAGKTTLLLELADELCIVAEQLPNSPVPAVLSLAEWPEGEKNRFESWVAEQLHRFYDLSEREARYIIEHGMLALLLDGLDEVPADRLSQCVKALNTFRDQRGGTPIAVTCRLADYERYVKPQLKLVGAVLIKPLTLDQVDRWLVALGPEMNELRSAMHTDQPLHALVRNPLTLNIAAMTYRGAQVKALTDLDSLFDAYTQRMLQRRRTAATESRNYPEADVRRWLTALAKGMIAADAAVIPAGLATRFRAAWVDEAAIPWQRLPRLVMLRGGLPMAIVAGLTTAAFGPWPAAPVVAALAAAVAWIRAEAPNWFTGEPSPYGVDELTRGEGVRRERAGVVVALALAGVGLMLGVSLLRAMFSLLAPSISMIVGGIAASAALLVVLPTAIALSGTLWVAAFARTLSDVGVSGRIGRSGQLALAGLLLLVAGLATGAAGAALAGALSTLAEGIVLGEMPGPWPVFGVLLAPAYVGVAGGLLLAAQYAISDLYTPHLVYQHMVRAGLLPARLKHFLAWADDRILLRKEGDNYTFLHRLYRDWWATQASAGIRRYVE